VAAGTAGAGPIEDAKKLLDEGKAAEAAQILETLVAEDAKATEPVLLLMRARFALRQWEAYADALIELGRRGVAFETTEPYSRDVLEQITGLVWSANDDQRIAVCAKLCAAFPKSPWRIGWLSIRLSAHARKKQAAEMEAVEAEIYAQPLDHLGSFRVGRAYLEGGVKPEKAVAMIELALDAREALPLPEDPLARETALTEMSVWRSYLAFAYAEAGRTTTGNRFWEAEPDAPGFDDVTAASGLEGAGGQRVAVGDFDGDGWEDVSLNGAVWRNAKGVFEALPQEAGAAARGSGSLWGDADGDGDLDLWVFARERAVTLLMNDAGTFSPAADTGMDGALEAQPEGAGLADANGDGILDAYLAVYEGGDLGGGRTDRFFVSEGKGRWRDALEGAGMGAEKGAPLCGRGVNWGDFDDDGDADAFVSNYRLQPNYLWRNDGNGAFVDAARELGVKGVGEEVDAGTTYYGHTIGSCWADLDNDLDLDLVSANLAHPRFIKFSNRTQILMNQGARHGWKFCDIFPWSGVPYEETHSDVSACDWDNDGDLDLHFTSVYRERPSWLLRNDGRAHFEPVTWRAGAVAFNGWGHAWFDFDNDGDMDLLVCAGGRPRLLRNGLEDGTTWLQVELKGRLGGVGARVTVHLGDLAQTREIAAGRGTTSQDSARAHFGFGARAGTAAIAVRWPGGKVQRVEGVELNRRVMVEEAK
jgi:hypothetical protein